MEKKAFWKSRTFWGAVISALATIWEYVVVPAFGAPHIPEQVFAVLQMLGISVVVYGRAVADKPLGLSDYGRARAR